MLVPAVALILLAFRGQGVRGGQVTIHTKVLKADGQPAAGAAYYLVANSDTKGQFVAAKGQASSSGDIRIDEPKKEGETPSNFVVRCPGQALFYASPTKVAAQIHLSAGVSATIAISLPDGTPARNLPVVPISLVGGKAPQRPHFLPFFDEIASQFEVRTGDDGICTFTDMPPGDTLGFDVHDDRFDRIGYQDQIELREGKTEVKHLKLKRGASLSGHLTLNGKPVPDVEVTAQALSIGQGWGNCTTDSSGAFTIKRLSEGAYNVALNLKPPVSDAWTSRAEEVTVRAGETKAGVELTLERGGLVAGRVVDEEGTPQKGIMIGIYGPAHPQTGGGVQSSLTDSAGRYRMRVPAGEQYVYVMSQGGKSKTLTVAEGMTASADFSIQAPGKDVTILGHVKNDRGEPVPNAMVDVLFTGANLSLEPLRLTADSSGRFSFVKPPSATETLILARAGVLASPMAVTANSAGEVTVKILPRQLASATGVVLDLAGKPLAGAEIQVYITAGEIGFEWRKATSGPDGRFKVDALYPGRQYGFDVTAPGFGEARVERLTPLPAESVNLKQFRLAKADSYIVGYVKDLHGAFVVGATVGIEDMRHLPATTDSNGRFVLDRVPKGKHRMYAERGNMHVDMELAAGRQGQVVVLRPPDKDEPPAVEFGSQEPIPTLKLGSPALELETKTWLNSKPLKISQLRGKVVVLDFWGVWCRPCVEALPAVERLAKEFNGKPVVVIGIHDSDGLAAEMAAFAKKKGLTYPLTIDRSTKVESPGITAAKYRVIGFPALVVIDQQGKVAGIPETPERAEEMVKHLLK